MHSALLKLIDMRLNGDYNTIMAPTGNLGISRSDMPQIDFKYRDKFIAWLNAQGIKVKTVRVPIKSLRLTQSEYDRDKVMDIIDKMKQTGEQKKFAPIFVSKDGYVLDGSHRLIAKLNLKDDARYMEVAEIDMDMAQLIHIVRNFPNVRFRSLSDKEIK